MGQQWRAMEDCSTHEWLQQETLCRRQRTDEYVERPETLMRQKVYAMLEKVFQLSLTNLPVTMSPIVSIRRVDRLLSQ